METKSDMVIDAAVANEGDGWRGSGANPWHLDKETESIVFLTDAGDKPARIAFSVTVAPVSPPADFIRRDTPVSSSANFIRRETPVGTPALKLAPHETRAI